MVYRGLARKLVGLLVAVACCLSGVWIPAQAAEITALEVAPSTTTVATTGTSYTFRFGLPSGLVSGEDITFTWPVGFDVSKVGQTSGSVTCTHVQYWPGQVSHVSVAGQAVTLRLSYGLFANGPVIITFQFSAQISSPASPGFYSVALATLHDSGFTSIAVSGGGGGGGGAGGVTNVVAVVPYADAGKAGEYSITFGLSTENGTLVGESAWVDVEFPSGSFVPPTIATGSVFIRGVATSVSVDGLRVRLRIPDTMYVFPPTCTVEFMREAGILHPSVPGTYVLRVATSQQPNFSTSNPYSIFGTSILNLSANVEPARQGIAARYQLTFTSSTAGTLAADSGRIVVEFPPSATIPAPLPAGAVRILDLPAPGVPVVSGNKVTLAVPTAIPGGSTIRVDFGLALGIRNPAVVGTYQLMISTSADATPIPVSYIVSASQVGDVTAQVSNSAAGQAAAYTVSFTTGSGGALAAGYDRIDVEFPAGTTIPTSITTSSVTIDGIPSTLVTTSGRIASVTVPGPIAVGTRVALVFAEAASFLNPVTGGTYTLRVSTSRETTAVTSTGYNISSLPVVTATVTPPAPNGQGGYYRTKPTIALTAQSAVDAQPVISYHFDANADSVYAGQALTALEGTHTLTYYAMDRLGSRSATGTLTIAVDSVPPVIALTSPKDGEVLNSSSLVVRGVVDVGSTVRVNGQSAPVDATGAFSSPVTIQGTAATVVVDATDVAGNTAQRTVSISVDKVAPVLTLSQPVNFQRIQRLPIVVAGKTEAGATVTVQNNAATVLADGSFEYAIANAVDGLLTIAVIARDAAGNATTRTIAVSVLSTKIVQMQVGAKAALVNGQSVTLQTAPVISNSTTLVPLRFVAETFGITPAWDGVFQIIDLPIGTGTIRLQIGQRFAGVGGKRVALDAAPVILGGVTMVPLRFIADALGADTQWEAATRTIMIVYPKAS